jgi:hypothetical protein
MTGEGEEKRREEKEKNCHMLIISPLNEGAVIKKSLNISPSDLSDQ